jgi:hypothetical protein
MSLSFAGGCKGCPGPTQRACSGRFDQYQAPSCVTTTICGGGCDTVARYQPDDKTSPMPKHSPVETEAEQSVTLPDEPARDTAEANKSTGPAQSFATDGETAPSANPAGLNEVPGARIAIVAAALPKPRRSRDKDHIRFIARQPCTVCGRKPCEAHHIRFAQPRALGRKVSDEFTVPLCRVHHRELHRQGDEAAWWARANIDPMSIAFKFWQQTQGLLESPTAYSVT